MLSMHVQFGISINVMFFVLVDNGKRIDEVISIIRSCYEMILGNREVQCHGYGLALLLNH